MNKSESISIQNQIKEYYSKTFPSNGTLILGVSGGPDSMGLLYLLYKNEIPVFAVHVNYGLRGNDSDADQQLVEEVCAMWNIECCSVRVNSEEVTGNFQDWARNQRYQIFRDLKRETGAIGIAVAHHSDDQIETIFLKMLRGAGISNWKGLELWNGEIFRPLLEYSKSQIVDYCEFEAIPYRKDATNNINKYARNSLRNKAFKVFDDFIPGWKSNLKEVGNKARAADEAFDELLEVIKDDDALKISGLKEFSNDLKAALIQRFVKKKANYKLSKGEINEVIRLIESQTGKSILLDDTFSLIRDRDMLCLKRAPVKRELSFIFEENEQLSGTGFLDWKIEISKKRKSAALSISSDKIVWPIRIRRWVKGDEFRPFGMSGSQKVSDHLTNRKINASLREETLILIDSGGTICAILYPEVAVNGENGCISDLVKITPSTKSVLSISKT